MNEKSYIHTGENVGNYAENGKTHFRMSEKIGNYAENEKTHFRMRENIGSYAEDGKTHFHRIRNLMLRHREIISYLIVGLLTTIVSLGSYYLCIYTFFDPSDPFLLQCANIISWVLAVTFAYFANRKYVFLSKDPHVLKEAAAFYAGRVGTLLLDMGCMALFVTLLGWNASAMKLVDQVLITIANYLISKLLVFRRK